MFEDTKSWFYSLKMLLSHKTLVDRLAKHPYTWERTDTGVRGTYKEGFWTHTVDWHTSSDTLTILDVYDELVQRPNLTMHTTKRHQDRYTYGWSGGRKRLNRLMQTLLAGSPPARPTS